MNHTRHGFEAIAEQITGPGVEPTDRYSLVMIAAAACTGTALVLASAVGFLLQKELEAAGVALLIAGLLSGSFFLARSRKGSLIAVASYACILALAGFQCLLIYSSVSPVKIVASWAVFPIAAIMLIGVVRGSVAVGVSFLLFTAMILAGPHETGSEFTTWSTVLFGGAAQTISAIFMATMKGAHSFLLHTNATLESSLTDTQKNQEELLMSEKLASIGRLSAGIAHEINNPVGFVSSNFTTLKDYLGRIRDVLSMYEKHADERFIEKRKKTLKLDFVLGDIDNLVMENIEGLARITNIVNNLKNFARSNPGHTQTLCDINEGIRSVLLLSKNEWKYHADIQTEFANLEPVLCDINELNQVFLNMIMNAVQAIKSQKRDTKGAIIVRTSKDPGNIVCKITDDGPGIPENIRDKIFDPFFSTKDIGEGTGLGLNISYDIIVNRHKGKIEVSSEVGKGTTFTITIPRRTEDKGAEPGKSIKAEPAGAVSTFTSDKVVSASSAT